MRIDVHIDVLPNDAYLRTLDSALIDDVESSDDAAALYEQLTAVAIDAPAKLKACVAALQAEFKKGIDEPTSRKLIIYFFKKKL